MATKSEPNDIAEALLANAARLQTEFWDAIGDLEKELGIEIDSSNDLQGVTVEDLLEETEDESDD